MVSLFLIFPKISWLTERVVSNSNVPLRYSERIASFLLSEAFEVVVTLYTWDIGLRDRGSNGLLDWLRIGLKCFMKGPYSERVVRDPGVLVIKFLLIFFDRKHSYTLDSLSTRSSEWQLIFPGLSLFSKIEPEMSFSITSFSSPSLPISLIIDSFLLCLWSWRSMKS